MIITGEITQLNYVDNFCKIRLPSLEGAGNLNKIELKATFCITPGQINFYKVGDPVYVGFEYEKLGSPIILGKVMQLPEKERARSVLGAASINELIVTSKAALPRSTVFTDTDSVITGQLPKETVSITDIINQIKELSLKIESLQSQLSLLTPESNN